MTLDNNHSINWYILKLSSTIYFMQITKTKINLPVLTKPQTVLIMGLMHVQNMQDGPKKIVRNIVNYVLVCLVFIKKESLKQ